ncbi:MAG: DUF1501 domain-containing protein [Planctomycetia bacterium]|nr:DUF1501 domain-containing protein [Planctomycetia bacterium]
MTSHEIDSALTLAHTRRHFFRDCGVGVGAMALSTLLVRDSRAAKERNDPLAPKKPHFAAKAKAVIFLFMAGGPSQLDLFEPKPDLNKLSGQKVPESFTKGKRFAFIKGDAKLLGTPRKFEKVGQCGMDISDLLPHHKQIADELCWVRSMKTDVFNHGPAKCFVNTGSPQFGRPSMGAWLTYGLGSESDSLPGFVVLQSGPRGPRGGAALYASGFLPSVYQGVPFLRGPNPILDLAPPPGVSTKEQGEFIDTVTDLNKLRLDATHDPEIQTRIAAYEMAYRMQTSAPELMDLSKEPKKVLEQYGAEVGKPSFAANCVLARRLVQRGVRFVQLYHTNWDHHGGTTENLEKHLPPVCKEVDQPSVALVRDLKQLGLLDSTIVIWGGEFGRTPMGEVREATGRDHHIDAYTMWLAGGGFKPGYIHGKSDEIGYNVVENEVHVHDLQATILNQMGMDHTKLTFRFQGRDYRLTDVHGKVVKDILA